MLTNSELFAIDAFDERKIDAVFGALNQCQRPGAAVGIAIGGRPVYRKAFGLASIELPMVLTPTTRMRIGSTSKHFTALAWMLLCEAGQAELDTPIGTYLPELHEVSRGVTARQLLTHTSGLRDVFDISWHFNGTGRRVSGEDLLSMYRTMDAVNERPGVAWIYNNGGYVLVTAAIERITGRSLEEVLRERIFAPIGMYGSVLRRWDSDFLPNSATLHTLNAQGAFERSYLGTEGLGQGGIASTVDDMLCWLEHMGSPHVGTAATWETMFMPQRLQNGVSTNYGLGLRKSTYRGVEMISHSGGVMGGNCQMLKVPAANLDVVVIVNRSDVFGVTLADRILDACLPALAPAPIVPAGELRSGTFQSPRTGRVVQLIPRSKEQIASIDGFEIPMAPDESGALWPAGIQPQKNQAIRCGEDSPTPRAIQLTEFGSTDELERIAEPPPQSAPTGRYAARVAGVEADIVQTEHGPEFHVRGLSGWARYELAALGGNLWRARMPKATFPPGGVLSFDRDGSGFSFSTFRTRGLRFARCA